ncbi:cytochrome P450 [Daedalea quercina L-15889]|uniref:Cytochrome P450 n=1 Tax=Daedalea quercina L-15889 TaxID=1314783 RepID=A0A165ML15_9APHY|nr:cytochrome P450 [Daedalea quercina L-15889]
MVVITVGSLLLSLGVAVLGYGLYRLASLLVEPFFSPLRDLPGPPSPSFIFGNLKQIFDAENSVLHEAWTEQYGTTLKYKTWFNRDRLYTVDTRALNHILSHSIDYQKPFLARHNLGEALGEGVLVVEGEQHRQQRRIMNPAFGPAQIRELTEILVEKAIQLRDVWDAEISKVGEPARINVMKGLSKMTLDAIGLAGFNYNFHSLNVEGKPNELNSAFEVMFGSIAGFSLFPLIKAYIPPLRIIPDARSKRIALAQKVMRRIGLQLVAEKKAEILKAINAGEKDDDTLHGRDLLTLLIKANMATDIPESQRLSDEDVLAQVPTFLVAGHETTSNATTWCLYALTQAPDVQQRLREELFTVSTDNPTMDELNALPYLDAVVRETMRVHAPVPSTIRIAVRDDVIPLNTPYVDVRGQVHDTVRVTKGTPIFIPILALNRSKALWGEDAFEFKPERWQNVPEAAQSIPGVWGNQMSFLGGPRACIGYRFSLVEMKALVFALVRAFELELAVPASEIVKKATVVQRPLVKSEMEKGNQMPLLLKRYQRV